MSLDRKASVEIDVRGAERAAAAARAALDPWAAQTEKVKSAFKTLGGEVKSALGGVLKDLSSVVTVGSSISFAGAVQGVKSLELAASKMSVASGRSFDEVKAKINSLSEKLKTSPEQIASYVSSVGKATYDFSGAEKSLEAFNKFAKESGRELSESSGLAVAFKNLGIENADKALRQLRGTAEQLKTVGGVAALSDQFTALSGTIGRTSNDAGRMIGVLASLGKGLSPQQAQEAQQAVLGGLESKGAQYEAHFRYTGRLKPGESLFDANGKLDVVKLARLRQTELKGLGARGARIARAEFGGIGGAQFMNANFGMTGQESDTDAAAKFEATPGGQAEAAKAAQERNMQAHVGHGSFLGGLRESFASFAGNNPLTAYGLGLGGSTLLRMIGGKGIAAAGKAGFGSFGSAFGMGTVGGGLALAGIASSLAALGATVNPLNAAMPQIRGETEGQLDLARVGRARALVRAAERGGGTVEGFVGAAGPGLLAQTGADPALKSLAQQLVGGGGEIKDLPEKMGREVAKELRGSPLHITVVMPGGERIVQDQSGGAQ